jgi:hypothetical protein
MLNNFRIKSWIKKANRLRTASFFGLVSIFSYGFIDEFPFAENLDFKTTILFNYFEIWVCLELFLANFVCYHCVI